MCLTMIDHATSWFEMLELPTVRVMVPKASKGKKAACLDYTKDAEIFDKTSAQISSLVYKCWFSRYPCCWYIIHNNGQRETVVTAALALRQQYTIHGDVLEQVEVYKYLGRMMAQDDNNAQAIRTQLRKARATWAWVGKVLWGENTPLTVAAKFYLAVVQAVLLYGSETWVTSPQAMARL